MTLTYTHDQIIDSLIVIKTTCQDFDCCENGCPFWKDEECCIQSNPTSWVLNESNQNWKAFL